MLESANLSGCLHQLTTVSSVLVSFLGTRTASAVYTHGLQSPSVPSGSPRLQQVPSMPQYALMALHGEASLTT